MDYLRIFTKYDAEELVNKYEGKLPPIQLMGDRCDGFFYKNDKLISIEDIKVDKAKDLFRLFYGCKNLIHLPDELNLNNVLSTDYMFSDCTKLTQDFKIIAPNLKTARGMFSNCIRMKKSPELVTNNVVDYSELFSGCISLVDISGINFSSVTNLNRTFFRCEKLKMLPEGFNISNCRLMNLTFSGCKSLKELPKLNTSNVIQMEYTFENCSKLKELPELDTSSCTTIWMMCSGCSSLKSVHEMNFDKLGDKLYTYNTIVRSVYSGCPNPEKLAKESLGSKYLEFMNRDNKYSKMVNFNSKIYNTYSRLNYFTGRDFLWL